MLCTGRWDVISSGLHSWHRGRSLARPNAPPDTGSASSDSGDGNHEGVTGSNVVPTSRARLTPRRPNGH